MGFDCGFFDGGFIYESVLLRCGERSPSWFISALQEKKSKEEKEKEEDIK